MTTLAPGFGRLWSASFLSNMSDGVRAAAFPLLAAALARDPLLVAGVTVAQQVPWLVSGPLAGVVADRVDRRALLWRVNFVRAAIFALMAVSLIRGGMPLVALYLAAIVLGIGETLYDNAAQTVVPEVVPQGELERANGRLVAGEVVANEFLGPALGAFLFGIAIFLPFAGNAGFLAVAVLVLVGLARAAGRRVPERIQQLGLRQELAEGFRFVRDHRQLSTITILVGLLNAADAAWFSILVLYTSDILGLPPAGFGIVLAVGGLGGIAGAVGAEKLSRCWSAGALLTATLLLAACAQLALGLTTIPAAAIALIAVTSLAFGVWNVVTISLRQRSAPSHVLGRVNAIYRSVGMTSAMLGALIGGVVADAWGLRAPFLIGVPFLLGGAVFAKRRLTPPDQRTLL